jgi:NAD(P)H-dependent flavin oxidoreductase YrpB (nitropropane dioxygenase family)
LDGRGLAGQLAVGASGVAMGTRFLLTKDSWVADNAKERYLQASVTDTVVTRAIDGAPQRVIRTELIDRLEKAKFLALPKAAANALRFRKMTGTSFASLLKEGLAMKKAQDLSWAQMAMAANAPMMTKAAIVDGHLEVGILPTGQGVGAIDDLPTCQELIDRIVAQAIEQFDRICGPK